MDWKAEATQALEEIRKMVKDSELSQRMVEDRAGFSRGYLSQLLARNLDLKLWHVLAILDVLDRNPGEFFSTVYPGSRHPALEQFKSRSQPLPPEVDDVLARLYKFGVESLDDLRKRLARCEQAVSQIEAKGYLDDKPAQKPEK
ncbi:MAG: helix-turn-helix transcriptional regulator [bacterium]|nr:helix-turn-helix transcriptional regulator [bacterium]